MSHARQQCSTPVATTGRSKCKHSYLRPFKAEARPIKRKLSNLRSLKAGASSNSYSTCPSR